MNLTVLSSGLESETCRKKLQHDSNTWRRKVPGSTQSPPSATQKDMLKSVALGVANNEWGVGRGNGLKCVRFNCFLDLFCFMLFSLSGERSIKVSGGLRTGFADYFAELRFSRIDFILD